MYFIFVYDIASPKRLPKVMKLMRGYLHHVQNSVFEGELTPAACAELELRARRLMNTDEDSLIVYNIGEQKWLERTVIGIEKRSISNFV